MSSVARFRQALAPAILVLAWAAGSVGCSGEPGATSRSASPPTPEAQTVPVAVFYVDEHRRLVARSVPVDRHVDRIEAALAIAGTSPQEADLQRAFPAEAFADASFDGSGEHSQVGLTLASRSFLDASPGMAPAQARLAIRAAVCTARNGSDTPVVFYFEGEPVDRLFGRPLPGGAVRDDRCPREGV